MRQLVCLLLFLSVNAFAEDRYEVFTLQDINVDYPASVTVYHLTAGDQWLKKLNAALKQMNITNEQDAAQLVTDEFKQTLSNQSVGLAKAAKYKLKYFPAIVLNEKSVLYGTTDIQQVSRYVAN